MALADSTERWLDPFLAGRTRRADLAGPVLRVRLQEVLGVRETPTVAGGEVAVLGELLPRTGRPDQVTRDLGAFWTGSYAAVKAEMKGRHPRHFWPDDPLSAVRTKQTKKAMDRRR